MIDVTEILVHWHAGRSLNEMSQSLGVDRKTIRKYVAPAIAAGIIPGGPAKSDGEWAELVREWFPELADTRLRQVTWPAIGVHHDYIAEQLKAGVRMSTIHQRLRDEHGLAASVASLRRYVAANVPEEARRSQVTVWSPRLAEAGEQAQIDYGQLGRWLDPVTGKLRTVWAFVMVLACSRHMFVRPVLKIDQRAWTECHVEAFAFFGGVPGRLVPDNLKTGVDKPDLYDPKVNRSYAELAAHYGCLIDPARALKPRDKARVERPMPYVRDSFWRGREFASLQRMQAEAARWSAEVAGRGCRPLEGAAPAAMFDAVEREALRPLPRRAVRAGYVGDGEDRPRHTRPGRQGAVLRALAAHRQDRRRPDHRQHGAVLHRRPAGQVPSPQGPGEADRLRGLPAGEDRVPHADPGLVPQAGAGHRPGLRAADRGAARRKRPLPAPRRPGRHRPGRQARLGRLEAACAKAITAGDPSYRTVRGILAAGAERDQLPAAAGDGGAAAFLRGPASFANVIPMPGTIPSDAVTPVTTEGAPS